MYFDTTLTLTWNGWYVWMHVEWSTAVLAANVRCCLGHSRAALHLHLLWGRIKRPTHNVGQANVSHVRLWTQTERRRWTFVDVTRIADLAFIMQYIGQKSDRYTMFHSG